jgi:CheY-like chemotaxis protein
MSVPRLLVIDQDPSVQHAVEAALSPHGFEVTTVGDGLSALDVALATAPDIILAEYRMDGMNIFRFFEKLKQKNVLKTIALLLLVNPTDVYDELTLRLVGVSDFLRKPLNVQELLDRVKRYVPTPATVPSATPPVKSPKTKGDEVNIEDIMGWSRPSGASPFSELSQERSGGIDLSVEPPAAAPETAEDTLFLDRNEITPSNFLSPPVDEHTVVAPADHAARAAQPSATPTAGEWTPGLTERPSGAPPRADSAGSANGSSALAHDMVDRVAKDVVEKVAWELLPGLAQQSMERIIKDVVERVVWEAVPSIAETAIKQEIERLKKDNA